MALTDDKLRRFDGPSVWQESDCVEWLYAITGIREVTSVWHECTSEARALARAIRVHGSYGAAVLHGLRRWRYHELQDADSTYLPSDVVIVDDPTYGPLPAGVAPGPELLIRHPFGVSPASGTILYHMRRIG